MTEAGESTHRVIAVVVNYNTGEWLKVCVSALLESTQDLTIYVVDNASSDNSVELLETLNLDPDAVRVVKNTENVGFARANNQILGQQKADFFVLVNPDCLVQPETIKTILFAVEPDRDVGLASCLIENPDGTPQKTCKRDFPTPWSGLVRVLGLSTLFPGKFPDFDRGHPGMSDGVEYVDAISGAFMVVRGSALNRVGYLDENYFMHCEDLDWCKRFWQQGYKVAFVPSTSVTHAKGGSGRSLRVNWHLHRGMLRFYRKFYIREYPLIFVPLIYLGVFVSLVTRSATILIRGSDLKQS